MNKEEIKIIKEIIKNNESNFDFNDFIENYINDDDLEEIEDLEDLKDYLVNLDENLEITQTEVIYYSNAIEYLKENDPSLNESLDLARDFGYTIENINSEFLASLLKSSNNIEDYGNFVNKVIDDLEDLIFIEEEEKETKPKDI